MIGAVEEGAQPVPTLDDYTAALAELHRQEAQKAFAGSWAQGLSGGANASQQLGLMNALGSGALSQQTMNAQQLQQALGMANHQTIPNILASDEWHRLSLQERQILISRELARRGGR